MKILFARDGVNVAMAEVVVDELTSGYLEPDHRYSRADFIVSRGYRVSVELDSEGRLLVKSEAL